MPFRAEDWVRLAQALALVPDLLARARAAARTGPERQQILDQAIWHARRFAEYAVNALLQLASQPPEQHHQLAERIEELRAEKLVQGDYARVLEQLTRYRLKADYLSYSREPSVHFSTADLERCLAKLQALQVEVEALLRAKGWL